MGQQEIIEVLKKKNKYMNTKEIKDEIIKIMSVNVARNVAHAIKQMYKYGEVERIERKVLYKTYYRTEHFYKLKKGFLK